jgi:hypothetical protein
MPADLQAQTAFEMRQAGVTAMRSLFGVRVMRSHYAVSLRIDVDAQATTALTRLARRIPLGLSG